MALIKCPECGREISDKATSCPHCGNLVNQQGKESYRNTKNRWILPMTISLLVILVIGAVLIFMNRSKKTDSKVVEEIQVETTNAVDSVRPLHIADFIETKTIDWGGVLQKQPSYIADKYLDESETTKEDLVDFLKNLGFVVVRQKEETYEGEGGEPYQVTITNLKQEGGNGCEIETNGLTITITFKDSEQAKSFIKEATDLGFRFTEVYNGWSSYSWYMKDDNGNEFAEEIFISHKDNQVSITSGYEL